MLVMDMEQLLTQIMENTNKKCIQRNCRKLLKKCSFKCGADLQLITETALWLYIFGQNDDAATICGLITAIPFTGNHTLWDHVDTAICLKARILREKGYYAEAADLIEIVNFHRNPSLYPNLVNWFAETLDRNIEANLQDGSKAGARSWRIVKLQCAVKYREAGGFLLSDNVLEQIIKELRSILFTET